LTNLGRQARLSGYWSFRNLLPAINITCRSLLAQTLNFTRTTAWAGLPKGKIVITQRPFNFMLPIFHQVHGKRIGRMVS
jgi:hypothetical protein